MNHQVLRTFWLATGLPKRKEDTMPRIPAATHKTEPRLFIQRDSFEFGKNIGIAMIGLMATLIGTGIVSMVSLSTRVATITESVGRTDVQMSKYLDHSVDKEEYRRRDAEIQEAIRQMATREEVRSLRDSVDSRLAEQTETLRAIHAALMSGRGVSK